MKSGISGIDLFQSPVEDLKLLLGGQSLTPCRVDNIRPLQPGVMAGSLRDMFNVE